MYRKFNTVRASLVRMRNKSRSPSRFISARRASFVEHATPAAAPRASGRGPGSTQETALPPSPSKQKSPETLANFTLLYRRRVPVLLPRVLPPSPNCNLSVCVCMYLRYIFVYYIFMCMKKRVIYRMYHEDIPTL